MACEPSHLMEVTPAAAAVDYLSSECGVRWIARSSGNVASHLQPDTIEARVPGDLISDLQAAGRIGDPLYETNFLRSALWSQQTWSFLANFSVDSSKLNDHRVELVFDGIKMGAHVKVNGKQLGTAYSQFMRYSFDLAGLSSSNLLEVIFDHEIQVGGRFMASSGGWDWAPYTNTWQKDARTFTYGIWKHVYLVYTPVTSASIVHVVPRIYYQGAYPTVALVDGEHGGFRVRVEGFLSAPAAVQGTLQLETAWGATAKAAVSLPQGNSSHVLEVEAAAKDIKLWWPAGMGSQPLYDLHLSFQPSTGEPVRSTRRVGFRYFALVTGNDTDPAYVAAAKDQEGTSSHGMYFRINGASFWSKGSNVIPMEVLEGRLLGEGHRRMVQSAAEGGMNTLRVWGGGIFMPDEFYDACDALGLVVFHDMMYAQSGHAPARTSVQDAELRHQVRRLSSHASIVIWDGCNECTVLMGTPTEIYASFVMTVVAQEDDSRTIWPSCPAYGWSAGVHRLDSRPNGKSLATPTYGADKTIEFHGPYQKAGGFPSKNGDPKTLVIKATLPVQVDERLTGPMYRNLFGSEFGAVVMSSFESMSATLAPEHWGLHGGQPSDTCTGGPFEWNCTGDNVMGQRNYPCDSLINAYFGNFSDSYFNTTGEAIFKRQLYQCMLAQSLFVKSDLELMRSQNWLGTLVWQLNEIWPTGGWGSIEYGAPVKGQVLGGRWKPLHYLYRRSLFQDVMAVCGAGSRCYVKNDGPTAFRGQCSVSTLRFHDGLRELREVVDVNLPAGPGAKSLFEVNFDAPELYMVIAECVRSTAHPQDRPLNAYGASKEALSYNEILLAPPYQLELPPAKVTAQVGEVNPDGSVDIELVADATALYVTLTTLAHGRFSDNAFAMAPGRGKVTFLPFGALMLEQLRSSLRVEHLQMYQKGGQEVVFV